MNDEKELDLKELFYNVFRNWKFIFLFPIISVFVFLIIKVNYIFREAQVIGIAKLILIGYVVGFFCMIFFYVFRFITSGVIKSSSELWNYSKLNLLGVVPATSTKKDGKIDLFIKRVLGGVEIREEDCQELINCIAKEVKIEMDTILNGKGNIALVSSRPKEEIAKFKTMVEEQLPNEIKLCLAGDIRLNSKGKESAVGADCVILVEKQFESRYSDLEEICRRLNTWKKKILGIVLLDVDAI